MPYWTLLDWFSKYHAKFFGMYGFVVFLFFPPFYEYLHVDWKNEGIFFFHFIDKISDPPKVVWEIIFI